MGRPHKWAKEIKAWADGAKIQRRMRAMNNLSWNCWDDVDNPAWEDSGYVEYRIKPEPREFYVVKWHDSVEGPGVIPADQREHFVFHKKDEVIHVREVIDNA